MLRLHTQAHTHTRIDKHVHMLARDNVRALRKDILKTSSEKTKRKKKKTKTKAFHYVCCIFFNRSSKYVHNTSTYYTGIYTYIPHT